MGHFTYPYGMAGTKRIQHAIDALKNEQDVFVRVVVLRQLNCDSCSGWHKDVTYYIVMGALSRFKLLFLFPVLFFKAYCYLRQCKRNDCKNIIYHYGPVTLENLVPLYLARHLGYRIIFDIVEDYDVADIVSQSFWHAIRIGGIKKLRPRMRDIASGFIVISSHLDKKYQVFTEGKVPIHYRPISIDMAWFLAKSSSQMNNTVTLFYAGSFGQKDGLIELLDAFDNLAAKRDTVHLVLSGCGNNEAMKKFFARVEASPFKDRIEYKGYLDDDDYYDLLNLSDIHCMIRIDVAYAHAGFPFKLGEYLASGKPVIATRVSDVERFLVNKESAMLVEPGDKEGIVNAAEYLIDNPTAASRIGQRGRNVAFSHFDHITQGKFLLSFMKKL